MAEIKAESKAGEFERSLERLEAIVRQLESEEIGLDQSVELFREGRRLARRCDVLLKAAREAIDAADDETAAPRGPGPTLFANGSAQEGAQDDAAF